MKLLNKAIPIHFVLALSISLLVFIGIGECYRVYPAIQFNNLCNQAELLKSSIETNLKLGVPLEFKGFKQRALELSQKSEQINQVIIVPGYQTGKINSQNKTISPENKSTVALNCNNNDEMLNKSLNIDWRSILFMPGKAVDYQITMNLSNKFTTVGQLKITPTANIFTQEISFRFNKIISTSILIVIFTPFIILFCKNILPANAEVVQKAIYHLCFLVIGIVIVTNMLQLYSKSIKQQSHSLAYSLSERLDTPLELGFDLYDDLSGFKQLLEEYRKKSNDISHIYLIKQNNVVSSSLAENYEDFNLPVSLNSPPCDSYKLNPTSDQFINSCLPLGKSDYTLLVLTPWVKIYNKLWRATRNILVLFLASSLISNIILNVLLSVQAQTRKQRSSKVGEQRQSPLKNKIDSPQVEFSNRKKNKKHQLKQPLALQIIKPVFALGTLIEAINISFLPSYFSDIFRDSGYSVSLAFGIYFIFFAITLIPAGRWAEQHSHKRMILAGLLISVVALASLYTAESVWLILILRAVAGIGQGLLFISVQSYLLAIENEYKGIKCSDQIVIGYNVSMISGAAIGGLIMPILGEVTTFLAGALVGTCCLIYTLIMVKDIKQSDTSSDLIKKSSPKLQLGQLLQDKLILRTFLLVGFPAKALFTGVLILIMPIMLRSKELSTDTIGQILLFYYIGVLFTTKILAEMSQLFKRTEWVLFSGCVGSGIGLLLISAQGWLPDSNEMVLILSGILMLGIFQGLIHAPVISYIVTCQSANQIGRSTVAAAYRFLERLGHVMGPSIATFFLLQNDGSINNQHMVTIAIAIILMAVAFILLSHSKTVLVKA